MCSKIRNKHNHAGDALAAERRLVRNDAHRIAAENPSLPTRRIIAQSTSASSDALRTVGLSENLARMIRHRRQVTRVEPPVPTDWRFEISEIFLTNNDGSPFVLFDSSTIDDIRDGRIIILGSRGTLDMLAMADRIAGDGSFSRSPPGFPQFYTVHAQSGQSFKPCVQFLMTQRTIPYYDYAFMKLKEIQPQFSPTSITMDYEQAVITSIQSNFPGITIDGCFFHLANCCWRNVCTKGLKVPYSHNPDIALHIRMLPCLAFLSPDQVSHGYTIISNIIHQKFDNQLDDFLDYFEDTFLGRPDGNGGRRAPRIPVSHWNLYMRVALDLPRTSNSLEAWHRAIKNSLPSEHPSIWRFFEVMKEELVLSMNHAAEADRSASQRPKYVKISADLQRYQQSFMSGTTGMLQFLTQCSNKIKFGGN
uniref:MULE transposase domain-containing protein n=1 Tax=Panagrolaimus davidi TaxID=227884 RepID=A0A914PFM4_9BILA